MTATDRNVAGATMAAAPPVAWTARAQVVLCAITALAAAVRLFRLELWSLDASEVGTWRAITMPLDGPDGWFASAASSAPLVPLALRWLLDHVLPGSGEGWLRLVFAFAGTLAVPLLGLLAARFATVPVALGAAALLASHPLHVAASQTADPLVVGATVALLAANAAAWSRLAAIALLLVALGCDLRVWPLAGVVLVALAGRLAERTARRLSFAFAALAVVVWCTGVQTIGWPVVVFAGAGLFLVPSTVAAMVAVPSVLLGAGTLAGGGLPGRELLAVLPFVLLLASRSAVLVAIAARPHLPGPPRLRALAAAMPALLLAVWLGVAATLYATLWNGGREHWREAARVVLAGLGAEGVSVAAGAGALPLTFYLRPAHFTGARTDPHPGIAVTELPAGDGAAADAWLATSPASAHWLVLRSDEAAGAERAAWLQRRFTLRAVLPGVQLGGDSSLLVYRHEPAR